MYHYITMIKIIYSCFFLLRLASLVLISISFLNRKAYDMHDLATMCMYLGFVVYDNINVAKL